MIYVLCPLKELDLNNLRLRIGSSTPLQPWVQEKWVCFVGSETIQILWLLMGHIFFILSFIETKKQNKIVLNISLSFKHEHVVSQAAMTLPFLPSNFPKIAANA